MLVGLNAYFLNAPDTGTGQYTRHLLAALPRHDRRPRLVPVVHRRFEAAEALPPLRVVSPALGGAAGPDWQKLWWEQITWPRACRALAVDVAHVPYFAPPWLAPRRLVVTIHDLIPLLLPEYVTSPLVRVYNGLISASARRATAIIADSQASKRDVVRVLGIPSERVHVIYLGADDAAAAQDLGRSALAAVRSRYELQDPFLLYLGGFDHRKNLDALLRALARLPTRIAWSLAVAGALPARPSRLFPDLPALARRLGVADRVRFLGRVSDQDKWALYRAATCFVFPSRYEGFGLDPLEAMACGAAVVCSNRSSLPEVVQDGGLLVDPDDEAALAGAIAQVLESPTLRADLGRRAIEVAAQFTWRSTAQRTLAVYEQVMGSAQP